MWIAPSDFSSACINPTQEYRRISRRICARRRKICKQAARKAVRRSLRGVALICILLGLDENQVLIIYIFWVLFKKRLYMAKSMCCMFFSPTSQHRTAILAYGFILQYVRNNHTLLSANPVRGSFGIHILRPCLCC